MGMRFRKSKKIAPGVRLNLSAKSASISVGPKGFKKTFSTSGRTTTTVGIPGTGLSYSTTKKDRGACCRQRLRGSRCGSGPVREKQGRGPLSLCVPRLLWSSSLLRWENWYRRSLDLHGWRSGFRLGV